jgi:hypothetical protein
MIKLFFKKLPISTILIAYMCASSMVHASEASTLQKVSVWIDRNAPAAQCEVIGTFGRTLAALPAAQQRVIYKKCGWHFLGVTKDGKARHPHAFGAIDPLGSDDPIAARGLFLRSGKNWDEWSDYILEKYKSYEE